MLDKFYLCGMKKLLLTLAIIFSLAPTIHAQRVGLVLSGGGAKGLYHVGMLKALEDNGIPVDYVSGASMGAIVGAMYCAGYSPEEMIAFFVTDSVQTWLSGKIPDEYRYYFKRYEPTPEMVSVNINPDSTKFSVVQLPTNVISPYRIDLAFMTMLQPASWAAGQNFDSLMVPFRCVASDVYNKTVVTFKDGSMPFAVRASMTIPFAFKPLSMDSTLLYDGGVYNNFPWQTLQEDFNPDVLIGGICAGNNENPNQNDLMGQVMVMITGHTDYTLPDSTDITVKRRFPEVGTLDYNKAPYIIAKGYEDAMKMMPKIKQQITRRVSQQEIQAKRLSFKKRIKPLIFEQISIEGLTPKQKDYVMRQLGIDEYQVVTPGYFEEKYMRILATELFTGEFPKVTFNPLTGFYRLNVKMSTKPSIKIAIGGNISSSSLNQGYIGFDYKRIGSRASNYYVRGYFGSFFNSVTAGGRHDMYTQFPFYIEYRYSYENINYDNSNNSNYYKNHDFRYLSNTNNFVSGSIGVPIWDNWAFRSGLTFGISRFKYFRGLHTSADISDDSHFSYGNLHAEVQSRQMNFTLFPTEGFNRRIGVKYTMGLEKFAPGTLSYDIPAFSGSHRGWVEAQFLNERIYNVNRWFNFGYLIDVTFSTHPRFANEMITDITKPVFAPTAHSATLFMSEYRSSSYIGVGVMPIFKFLRNENFYLRTYAYGFVPQEVVFDGQWVVPNAKRLSKYVKGIFGGDIIYQTPIGPASITVAKYTTGPKNWAFLFNFGYMIFGSRRY